LEDDQKIYNRIVEKLQHIYTVPTSQDEAWGPASTLITLEKPMKERLFTLLKENENSAYWDTLQIKDIDKYLKGQFMYIASDGFNEYELAQLGIALNLFQQYTIHKNFTIKKHVLTYQVENLHN
jgi:hypothetical protein